MVELKSPAEVAAMGATGAFIADLLDDLAGRADVGVNLLDLEERARELIDERGAKSCYWDYTPSFGRGPFRNVICLSVNDAVLHGLPHKYKLRDGDLCVDHRWIRIHDVAGATQLENIDRVFARDMLAPPGEFFG